MKRLLLAIVIVISYLGLHAQNKECNRLLLHQKGKDAVIYNMKRIDSLSFGKTGSVDNITIHNSNGIRDEFVVDNLDSIIFKNVEGRVAADVNIINYTTTSVTLDLIRTASCEGFKLMCMDYNSIASLSSEDIKYYIDKNVSDIYYQDFENVEITGLQLFHDTEYAIVTVGIDKYGLSCDVIKARFMTPAENLVGNPGVTIEVTQNELDENNLCDFTLSFTPNSETSKYSIFVAQAGVTEYQYVLFGGMEGWNNIGDMIEGWGLEFQGKASYQYTNETPCTQYEVYIQALDVNGVRAPYDVFRFNTKSLGGEGVANVEITLGEYVMAEWMNENYEWELMPSQFLTFTPNDQTSAYRVNVILADNYKSDIDGYQEDLCSDPFMPTLGWFQYETLTTDYQIDPNTDCVAIAAARNINGDWGPITELYFTTPNEVPSKSVTTSNRPKNEPNKVKQDDNVNPIAIKEAIQLIIK